jgi:hypothetical protein
MSHTGPIPLPRKYFGFDGAVEAASGTAGLHADTAHALSTITEPTKAETRR